jgi:uncharacterized protein (TIGR03067 family)
VIQKCLTALAGFALFLGAAVAEGKVKLPKGPAPRFFTVTEIGKDYVELKEVGVRKGDLTPVGSYKPALKDIEIYNAKGKKLSAADFRQRAKVGTLLLVAADENKVDPAYLRVVEDDTVVLVGVVVPVTTSAKSDHQKIQGSWHAVTLSTGPGKEDHIVFSGDKISWHVGKKTLVGTFVIDATKQPKRIDLKFTGEKEAPAVLLGIYDLRSELLVICIREFGGLRPTKLEAGKDQTLMLFYPSVQGTEPEMKK